MGKQYPLVSIIMPTYNRADYILETIESIRNQTYTNWELLIMDNGSDDDTEEILRSILNEQIHYWKFKPGFTGTLRNFAFQKARGTLIALMDSDDTWPETKLELQVRALKDNPEAGFSITNGYNFRGNFKLGNTHLRMTQGQFCGNIFVSFFKSETSIFIQSLLFWKKCLDVIGKFDETRLFNDARFLGDLSYNFKAVVLYEPLLYRRLHESNNSYANWQILSNDFVEALQRFKKEKKLPVNIANHSLFIIHINAGEKCLKNRLWKYAVSNFFQAWRYKPDSIVPLKKISKTCTKAIYNLLKL